MLREMCSGRLGEVEWFRSPWQRGGSATGLASWSASDGAAIDAFVKFPVGPREFAWTRALGASEGDGWEAGASLPTPRVLACGESIGPYDLAWIVTERLRGPALNHGVNEGVVRDLVATATEFHARALAVRAVSGAGEERDWDALHHQSRDTLKLGHVPESARWHDALRHLHKALPRLLALWGARRMETWCHGDLHPGNAMRRAARDGGPGRCVLLDMAFVHLGHWVEDAIYLERQFWAHREVLGTTKPVSLMARRRRELGLSTSDDYGTLAAVRRVLMAGCVPAWLETEGSAAYAHAALEVIERNLPGLVR